MTIIGNAIVRGMNERPTGITALDERIPFLLSQLGAHIAVEFQHRMSVIGVQPRAYAVLMVLATDDGQSQRQLSARLGIHRNAMVTVIDRGAYGYAATSNLSVAGLQEALAMNTRQFLGSKYAPAFGLELFELRH